MVMEVSGSQLKLDRELIRRMDRPGPRYTSYPTADRFREDFTAQDYRYWVENRNPGGVIRPLSLYVHVPFCDTVCFYCACNKVVTKDRRRAEEYLHYLSAEIRIQGTLCRKDPKVVQMHWGGGTPTYLSDVQIRELMRTIRSHFKLSDSGEYSIEVDPRKVSGDTVALLGELGFNRMSMGVQDFDPGVQRAVNRIQSEEQTWGVLAAARGNGFKSVSVDLIYGLPKQTVASFDETLNKVIAAAPDRIAVYNYAHLPALFKPQRRISAEDLPQPEERLGILDLAIRKLASAGYVYIGMDHFAKPEDELAVAQRQGRLHRNFQGYSTYAGCDLIGLGASAIGNVGPIYSQNAKDLPHYYRSLAAGELPVIRGLRLSADDLARRAVIQGLMCQFTLAKEAISTSYLLDFNWHFAQELEELEIFAKQGLVELSEDFIVVTPRGRFLIRNICMVFDRYLREDRGSTRYSRAI